MHCDAPKWVPDLFPSVNPSVQTSKLPLDAWRSVCLYSYPQKLDQIKGTFLRNNSENENSYQILKNVSCFSILTTTISFHSQHTSSKKRVEKLNWVQLKFGCNDHMEQCSGGSRFPRGGCANSPGGRQHTILPNFPKNCMKLKEFGPPEGARVPRAPLWSATAMNRLFCIEVFDNNVKDVRL